MTAADPGAAKPRGGRMILATRTGALPSLFAEQGFRPMDEATLIEGLDVGGYWIGPRSHLETDASFRQIIPYIVLHDGTAVVRYSRTSKGGEARLHGHTSIGVGGHVDLSDVVHVEERVDLAATLAVAAAREVSEEVGKVQVLARRWAGVIVDHDTEVGRVHIGIVGFWRIGPTEVFAAEDAIGEPAWSSIDDLVADPGALETWSSLVLAEPDLKRRLAAA